MNLVDALRGDELATLISEVEKGRREHVLKILDERGGAQELVRQQYSGRYPFELLQNANDAAADAGRPGRARFILTENSLIVADNGAGFGERQVRAICGLGRSSKDPRKSIGYKGLGFKSVGEITSQPQVFSSGAAFEFNESRVRAAVQQIAGVLPDKQRLPVYAFPFSMDVADAGAEGILVAEALSDGYSTAFRLPLRSEVDRAQVEAHLLHTLVPRLLLFLPAIEELELLGTTRDFRAVVTREPNGQAFEVLLDSEGAVEHWLVYRRACDVEKSVVQPLGDAWAQVEQVHIAIAVSIGEDGYPVARECYPLHVYFPTEEATSLPVIVQGDFALQLDRRSLALTPESGPYNSFLLDQVASLFAEIVAPDLATRWPAHVAPVAALTPRGPGTGLGAECQRRCVESLQRARFLPAIDGQLRLPLEATLLPRAIPDPSVAHRNLDLTGCPNLLVPIVEAESTVRAFLADTLRVTQMSFEETANLLKVPAASGLDDFYVMLVRWAESLGRAKVANFLSGRPCVLTTAGAWATPSAGVFFPRRRDDVDIPSDIPVPIAALPAIDGLDSLLRDAGVRDFEWRELLVDYLLPLLTTREIDPRLRSRGMNALRSYYASQRGGDQQLQRRIREVLLHATGTDGRAPVLRAAGSLYFTSNWTGRDALERLYGPFGESEFLAETPSDDPEQREADRGFYEWLGVLDVPRISEVRADQRDDFSLDNLARHPHRKNRDWWDRWIQSDEIVKASVCNQGHFNKQQLASSFVLDRFEELVASQDPSRLKLLWDEMSTHWGAIFQPATRAGFVCRHGFHVGPGSRSATSLFGYMLRELEWVPCRRGNDLVFVRPEDAWRLAPETPRWIARRVPVLDTGMTAGAGAVLATALRSTDAARPAPGDLCRLLVDLRDGYELEGEQRREISIASRWAMRALNESLSDSAEKPGGPVPLLSRYRDELVFTESPHVAVDPLLFETWQQHFPILDADRDLRRLYDVLGLAVLDDPVNGVSVRPISQGVRDDVRPQVAAHLDRCKPFLAAVAIQSAPSRQEEVVRGLVRLEIVLCDELMLQYEYDGITVERPEAVSYIAVRRETVRGNIRRNIATAHLEIDAATGLPDWYSFGPQLAQFLSVPTAGDAFAVLLAGSDRERNRYVASRRISSSSVETMRSELALPVEEEISQDFAALFDAQGGTGDTLANVSEAKPQARDDQADTPAAREADALAAKSLPEVKYEDVRMEDADAGQVPTHRSKPSSRSVLGPTGNVDFEGRERWNREIGRRGEAVALDAERRRVTSFGGDPSAVFWRSERNPLAPYDIESLDADGQRIYIEVKSTSGSDPSEPFLVSHGELLQAMKLRSSFYIYRVTGIETEAPSILRVQDPAGLLLEGRARLRMSDARMEIGANTQI